MELGYRIMRPSDVGMQPLRFAQISFWRAAGWGVAEGEKAVEEAIGIAALCTARGIRTVYHPLEYPLTGEHAAVTRDVLLRLAPSADLGIIIHDEGRVAGGRLSDREAEQYAATVRELSGLCPVSIENSYSSGDITWFWERFVAPAPEGVSLTLDIGHLELAGLDSVRFVEEMAPHLVERVRFVHMHHHDALDCHPVKDHKPLVPGCPEITALRELLGRKSDLRVILELDAAEEGMNKSRELLEEYGIENR